MSGPHYGPTNPDPASIVKRRYGSVVALVPELEQSYRTLHAATWPAVLDRLHRSGIRNYSIFIADLAGVKYLFSYFEYVGSDFENDMREIAADTITQQWWTQTDPCQRRLPATPEGEQWMSLESVFYASLNNGEVSLSGQ